MTVSYGDIGAGTLNSRIVVEQKALVTRPGGPGSSGDWEEWGRFSASVIPPLADSQLDPEWWLARDLYQFKIRRRTDISADMRVIWDGWIYTIRYINPTAQTEQFMAIYAERDEAV